MNRMVSLHVHTLNQMHFESSDMILKQQQVLFYGADKTIDTEGVVCINVRKLAHMYTECFTTLGHNCRR